MRITVICPLCGMWVHPNVFNVLKWPLRIFRRIMGGRRPHSKKGIIRFEEMDLPAEVNDQLVWRLEELASKLGYELKKIPSEPMSSPSRSVVLTSNYPKFSDTFEILGVRS